MKTLRRAVMLGTMCCLTAALPYEARAQNDQHGSHASPPGLVEAVRNATRQFQDVTAATDALYAPFLGCVSGTQEGAMGVHYVNGSYAGGSVLEVGKPEGRM